MTCYAAIDIGSNSVRMQAAEVLPGTGPRILASDRVVTRLGASVFSSGRIAEEAIASVCQVLQRMAETYKKLDVVAVRAVATSAVRDASNQHEFVRRASEAIGTPVEIISGQEEARLIHLGVQSRWPHPESRILILDVGGGSAELIVGEHGELKEGVSRPLGAVRLTEVFLKSDPPTETEIHRLLRFIDEKLEPGIKAIGTNEFEKFIVTSATAAAIVSAANEVPRGKREEADRMRAKTSQVRELFEDLRRTKLAQRKKIPWIGPRRAEIVVAGIAVFLRVLETLDLGSLYYSVAGVRDGIIADLDARGAGRERSRVSKTQLAVLEGMCRKYEVDLAAARHIARSSATLFDSLQGIHKLPLEHGKLLEAAAFLHNTGHFISDTGHHKHSQYVVMNSDLPGFTDQERKLIALLCRYHRKSMPATRHDLFQALPEQEKRLVLNLTPLLRLAVALDTGRQQKIDSVVCAVGGNGVDLLVSGEGDLDLEVWAAERAGDGFRQVYGLPLTLHRVKR